MTMEITAGVESSQRFLSSRLKKNRLYLSYTLKWNDTILVQVIFLQALSSLFSNNLTTL